MKKENEVVISFKVEELEKRFEMGWGGKGDDPSLPDDELFGLTIK